MSLPLRALAAAVAGLAAGVPFAAAFTGAARALAGSPGAAVGFVNSVATLVIVAGTPLVGLAFEADDDPRFAFACVAAVTAAAAFAARGVTPGLTGPAEERAA